ncbi:hypothetical protein M427DRAFT_66060 [Gonapodya prolifera JEL478]|uniref:Uncharacterized protein n=1 Tax=Gonapodya prolifera (strain JEL478) TaxID=1344416 RepID=A0A139AX97_GONPJ|nr:hypothetical protein M427DRAFT_66060 [Gonapodya prolifera JEL478]|eukprot:KXS21329.1 hypothetical protein M427DRAFT_66060 [Gonapodya prolifera JEL478]
MLRDRQRARISRARDAVRAEMFAQANGIVSLPRAYALSPTYPKPVRPRSPSPPRVKSPARAHTELDEAVAKLRSLLPLLTPVAPVAKLDLIAQAVQRQHVPALGNVAPVIRRSAGNNQQYQTSLSNSTSHAAPGRKASRAADSSTQAAFRPGNSHYFRESQMSRRASPQRELSAPFSKTCTPPLSAPMKSNSIVSARVTKRPRKSARSTAKSLASGAAVRSSSNEKTKDGEDRSVREVATQADESLIAQSQAMHDTCAAAVDPGSHEEPLPSNQPSVEARKAFQTTLPHPHDAPHDDKHPHILSKPPFRTTPPRAPPPRTRTGLVPSTQPKSPPTPAPTSGPPLSRPAVTKPAPRGAPPRATKEPRGFEASLATWDARIAKAWRKGEQWREKDKWERSRWKGTWVGERAYARARRSKGPQPVRDERASGLVLPPQLHIIQTRTGPPDAAGSRPHSQTSLHERPTAAWQAAEGDGDLSAVGHLEGDDDSVWSDAGWEEAFVDPPAEAGVGLGVAMSGGTKEQDGTESRNGREGSRGSNERAHEGRGSPPSQEVSSRSPTPSRVASPASSSSDHKNSVAMLGPAQAMSNLGRAKQRKCSVGVSERSSTVEKTATTAESGARRSGSAGSGGPERERENVPLLPTDTASRVSTVPALVESPRADDSKPLVVPQDLSPTLLASPDSDDAPQPPPADPPKEITTITPDAPPPRKQARTLVPLVDLERALDLVVEEVVMREVGGRGNVAGPAWWNGVWAGGTSLAV